MYCPALCVCGKEIMIVLQIVSTREYWQSHFYLWSALSNTYYLQKWVDVQLFILKDE